MLIPDAFDNRIKRKCRAKNKERNRYVSLLFFPLVSVQNVSFFLKAEFMMMIEISLKGYSCGCDGENYHCKNLRRHQIRRYAYIIVFVREVQIYL